MRCHAPARSPRGQAGAPGRCRRRPRGAPRLETVLAGFCSRPRVPACPRARARERGRGTPELRLGLAPGVVPGEASDVDAALLAAGSRDCHLPACAPPAAGSRRGKARTPASAVRAGRRPHGVAGAAKPERVARAKRPQRPDAAQCRAAVTLRGGYREIKSRRPWNRCGLSSLVLVRGGRAESLRRRTHVGKIPPWDAHGRVDPVTAGSPARPSSGRPVGPRPSPAPSGTWGSAGRGGRVGAWRVPRVSAGRGALVASSQEFRVRWHAARTPRDPLGPTAPPL